MAKKYEEIYEKLRGDITDKTLRYGQKIPSKRVCAEMFSASVITVEHAYELLESEGYIEPKARSGYYVCYIESSVIRESERADFARDFTFDSVKPKASREYFPFTVFASAARSVLNNFGEQIYEKSGAGGLPLLKKAIVDYLKTSRNVTAKERNVIIGAGAEYLYGIIAELFGSDKTFAVETPSYGIIEKIYMQSGAKVEKLRLGKDGILSEELNNSIADVLHVTPYRSFPTGVTASASKRAEYLLWAKKNGSIVVEDDYESEFSLSANLTETLFKNTSDDNVIYVNSFSKTIFPSLRTAYMILPDRLAEKYYEKFEGYSCPVPSFEQLIVAEILGGGAFARHINRVRRNRRKALFPNNTDNLE